MTALVFVVVVVVVVVVVFMVTVGVVLCVSPFSEKLSW